MLWSLMTRDRVEVKPEKTEGGHVRMTTTMDITTSSFPDGQIFGVIVYLFLFAFELRP